MSIEQKIRELSEEDQSAIGRKEGISLRDIKDDGRMLVLISQLAKGDYGPLQERARAQFEIEYAKAKESIHEADGWIAQGQECSSGYDFRSLIGCFGYVFLAHELTGGLEEEIGLMAPIVERVSREKDGKGYDTVAKAYIHDLFGIK